MTELFLSGYAVVIGVDDKNIPKLALPTVARDVQVVYEALTLQEYCA
jgi:hypothetical protein